MDGHGVYVWPIYAVALILAVLLLTLPVARSRAALRHAAMLQRREANEGVQGGDHASGS